MDKLIYTAMTGAKHILTQQAAVSHNMANATSTGFRTEMHKFRAVDVQDSPLASRSFVVDASVATDFRPGPLQLTGRTYDVAVEGKGWFAVQGADGQEAYTRNGSFELSAEGVLQTRDGRAVIGDGGPITVPPDNQIVIGKDGSISAIPTTGDKNAVNVIGRLKLVNPPEAELRRGEDGLFRTAGGAPAPADEAVQVAGGYLEGSNVNVVDQMVNMISLARQFEMQTQLLRKAETNDQVATKLLTTG
ncbi:flagellar basal-body rod protein FlgF [Denitromonas ohlonensis]|jgi:flagellar basal-body rod protein FlgF|uniref:Flagellar basal-body rod protein FlgF n=2 Tax=Denitromonas TaxID=139331 RepID=A0A557RD61_9RHOO|nr:flagellar basal-body rod protein FlgF [Denitromonas ohlonensis]TVO63096.1 flagellar basal-body rod protein FlgF [Denitromonas ohlonensis]TVO73653.1 flagellar basal-body rod protein FlgF [Denitromonas ohlonensis]